MRSSLFILGIIVLAFAKAKAQQPIVTDSTITTTVEAALDTTKVTVETIVEKQTPDEAVKEFFKYFHKKDTTSLRDIMVDKTSLNTLIISESSGRKITNTSLSNFLKRLAQIPDSVKIEERLIQIKTTNSNDIASVTTSYEFYMNEEFTHNGSNVFTLMFIDDKWKIAAIADTRQYA